jgi:hypothetical protein
VNTKPRRQQKGGGERKRKREKREPLQLIITLVFDPIQIRFDSALKRHTENGVKNLDKNHKQKQTNL